MSLQTATLNLHLRSKIKFGINVIDKELAASIIQEKKKKVFIVTDKGLIQAGVIDRIVNLLHEQGIETAIFSDVGANPTAESVMVGLSAYNQEDCDMILAVGGGSALDFAKALGVVASNPGHILDFRRGGKPITNSIPLLFALPTTIGTGSEVTAVAVITDTTSDRKVGIVSPLLIPDTVFVDPSLTSKLPRNHVAATGLDAFVHSIEAYTSIRANPLTDGLAMQAMKMILEYLPKTYAHPDDAEARSQVHLASTIAGLAFASSGLGLVHSCSHPMSALYKVPHGLANAIFLPFVLSHNLISNQKKYADIARMFDKKLVFEEDAVAAQKLVPLVRMFLDGLDIPKDFHYMSERFTDDMIDRMAEDAMSDVAPTLANPRKVYKEDVIKIYKLALPM